ncbi:heat shock transcription factor, Y-linked-like [Dromiciops gliroides]|uniref:heat shock transcription factor, Y-linked-like n=1 Tax=Dromiciops gliroides TaxID=33562 RepID=UPI001CC6D447|nr:heat shock transcription factor, Y-linked-like [Dromiciops gliroides]
MAEKSNQKKTEEFEMALSLSETKDLSPQDGTIDSEMCISSILSSSTPVSEQTSAVDSDLRSLIEENAFQALTERPLIKRPRFTLCDVGSVEENDFLSLTFPKKLWKIVESEQFKSIWWDNDGTCVVIDEELFKKEVLERKGPFRIFETDCMKSFIRQLNLYGFSKMRQDFQRSASLADFLAEEKEVSVLNKLQFYHNPNFKRGYPHLLVRMKRRVGIKNASPVPFSLDQDFSKSCLKVGGNLDSQKSDLVAESSGKNVCSTSTNSNVQKSILRKLATSKKLTSTTTRIRSGFSTPPAATVRPSEHIVADQNARLNQLAPFHLPQHSTHTQVNTHDIDSTTTTSATSLYRVIPPVQNSPFGPMMGLPTFPAMYPDLPAMQAHLASLLPFCNPWFSMPMIAAASAISMSRSSHHHRTPSYHHCPNCNCSSSNVPSTKGAPKGNEYAGYQR